MATLTRAAFLQDPNVKTPVFVRFSTVAGGAGSGDTPRDVRGFAVKFYTSEGNFDLVGNNIPVFFIQDAIKFPDLIHSVKMEPDRGFPQAASAHDTFWDFATLMPESMHMLMWAMSDRTIPRSFRMMEGFGVHTFRFVNADGQSTFVKFHWRPKIGSASLIWDEAVKLYGADPDLQRRDLLDAIARAISQSTNSPFRRSTRRPRTNFRSTSSTPRRSFRKRSFRSRRSAGWCSIGIRTTSLPKPNKSRFIPATWCRGSISPNDPLLQGRLFSYTDTQLLRLGGANFHEIPINRPKCPMNSFQRDGVRRIDVDKGQVAYEPNSLAMDGPREDPQRGFSSVRALGRATRFASDRRPSRITTANPGSSGDRCPSPNSGTSSTHLHSSSARSRRPQSEHGCLATLQTSIGSSASGLRMGWVCRARPTRSRRPALRLI